MRAIGARLLLDVEIYTGFAHVYHRQGLEIDGWSGVEFLVSMGDAPDFWPFLFFIVSRFVLFAKVDGLD